MSRAKRRPPTPLDLRGVSHLPAGQPQEQGEPARLRAAARPRRRASRRSWTAFRGSWPARSLRALARRDPARARTRGKPILWGLGAHVLKVGLSPLLIDLMERGFVTGIALNGAGIVHDFELAVAGQTSEDVDAGLGSGDFGMARETGEEVEPRDRRGRPRRPRPRRGARALPRRPARARYRDAEPAGRRVAARAPGHGSRRPRHRHRPHAPGLRSRRPSAASTHLDFRTFAALVVARLGGGGVYLNVGSAVLLPEVFLKAVTLARNLGHDLTDFATANLDFIQSYRPNITWWSARRAGWDAAIA